MSEADLFRQYAKEAMHGASEATSGNEKRALADLACTWVQAALIVGIKLYFVAARSC